MKLPWQIPMLAKLVLTRTFLLSAILHRRWVIRYHRDQKLDDRCWLDDFWIWEMLDDSPEYPVSLPSYEIMMIKCEEFYSFRQALTADPIPSDAIQNPKDWNGDLDIMNEHQLFWELVKIQKEIKIHRDIWGRIRTVDDDRRLYAVLPEKMPADFRLPSREDFLGEGKTPNAGCPSFWRSHNTCKKICNLRKWGPCPL